MATLSPIREAVYVRPYLYPKQLAAIFAPTRYAEIEASTKSGKTHGCIVWLLEQAFAARPGQHCWWVAPWYLAAEIAYDRAKRALPPQLYKSNDSKMTITLGNDVMIWFKSGEKPDALYGQDVVAAVIDEASRLREEAWHAVRSTLTATMGKVRLIGNVKGRKNWFWKLCRLAQAGQPDHTYSKLTYQDAVDGKIMNPREAEDARTVMPEAVWKELYQAEASDDQGNPFGQAYIELAKGPLSSNPPVVWGWDFARSVDFTWGVGVDAQGTICQSVRFQKPWGETMAEVVRLTGDAAAYGDSTGVGDAIVEQVQRSIPHFEGWKFTSQSKQQLMESLALDFQQGLIRGLPDDLAAECEAFEYVYSRIGVRYSAPEGMHDDGVCALALARMKFKSYALFDISGGGAVEAQPAMQVGQQLVDPEVMAMVRGGF